MEKNNYVKPTMVVVELKHRAPLICQSPPGDPDSDNDEGNGYIPNMGNDELNKLA